MPIGQFLQSNGNFVERLLPLIFQDELLQLRDDHLLAGISIGSDSGRRIRIIGSSCLLQKPNHFLHFFGRELAEHATNRLKDLYIFVFLGIADEAAEREIERAVIARTRDTLIEMGRASPTWP